MPGERRIQMSKTGYQVVFASIIVIGLIASYLNTSPRLQATQSAGPSGNAITHGPMLGKPGVNEMTVWARTARPGSFRVHFGFKPEQLDQTSPSATTKLEHDNTAVVRLTGLKAGTRYFYKVSAGEDDKGITGSFKTWPDSKDFKGEH